MDPSNEKKQVTWLYYSYCLHGMQKETLKSSGLTGLVSFHADWKCSAMVEIPAADVLRVGVHCAYMK